MRGQNKEKMKTHQSYEEKFEQWQSRSQREWDESDWEYEGKYMELEKRLREGEEQHFPQRKKTAPGRHEDAEREPLYERVEGYRLQDANRNYAAHDAAEKTRVRPDSQMELAQSRATDWQDFGDYEPGYSGHQNKDQRRGGILSGKDSKGESGKQALRRRTAKKTGNTRQGKSVKPPSGRSARSSTASGRRR